MINIARRYIPKPVRRGIHRLFRARDAVTKALLKASSVTGKCYCPVCSSRVKNFLPLSSYYSENLQRYGYKYSFNEAETCNASNCNCPFCDASDRARLYALYIGKYFNQIKSNGIIKIVDFAPSPALSIFIKESIKKSDSNFSYRTADLYRENVDDKVDITDMRIYSDNQFDFFICSHILEHIEDDKKALRELYRIIKPGGQGILMVPILLAIDVIDEDPVVTDIAERWRRFGQHDHVRMYSKKGFLERVKESGFIVHQLGKDFFGGEVIFSKNGITSNSVLYIVEKPRHYLTLE